MNDRQRLCKFMVPVCVLGMYGHELVAKVLASIEMPDHGDFPQHNPALRDWEATGSTKQV